MEIKDLEKDEFYLIDCTNNVTIIKKKDKTIGGDFVFDIFNDTVVVSSSFIKEIKTNDCILVIDCGTVNNGHSFDKLAWVSLSFTPSPKYTLGNVFRIVATKETLENHLTSLDANNGNDFNKESYLFVLDTRHLSTYIMPKGLVDLIELNKNYIFTYENRNDAVEAFKITKEIILCNITKKCKEIENTLKEEEVKLKELEKLVVNDVEVGNTYSMIIGDKICTFKIKADNGYGIYSTNKGIFSKHSLSMDDVIVPNNDEKSHEYINKLITDIRMTSIHIRTLKVNLSGLSNVIKAIVGETDPFKNICMSRSSYMDNFASANDYYYYNNGVYDALIDKKRATQE